MMVPQQGHPTTIKVTDITPTVPFTGTTLTPTPGRIISNTTRATITTEGKETASGTLVLELVVVVVVAAVTKRSSGTLGILNTRRDPSRRSHTKVTWGRRLLY
jgi:hypothetical protein